MRAPVVIALHGNLGGPEDWERWALPGLMAVDLWPWAEAGLSLEETAGELAAFAEAHCPGRAVLAGYSLGGRLALHALAKYPERWAAAAVLSAHPGLAGEGERRLRSAADARWAERARTLPEERFRELWDAQPVLRDAARDGTGRGRLRDWEARREAVARAFEVWSLGRQRDLRAELGRYGGPVLWLTGARDRKFTRLAAGMEGVFRDVRCEALPGCGHRLLEEPAAIGLLRDWLGTLAPAG